MSATPFLSCGCPPAYHAGDVVAEVREVIAGDLDEPEATWHQALWVDQPAPDPYRQPVPIVHADVVKPPGVGICRQAHLAVPTPDGLPYPPTGV
ncbi:hypothetical protein AB0C02_32755 [Micromonospora sp. NPDC048999]|uniref:hypothetical protein n=1 Tax=Micromonospora sp. NPDC048999 TaxID=3155391 RepID=UPI0033F91B3A